MLQQIRDRATGWIAWVIVILISVPFALWGIQQYLQPDQNVAAVSVNGNEVSIQRFRDIYQRQRQRIMALARAGLTSPDFDDVRIREQAMEQLVNDELLLGAASDAGLRVGDTQLAVAIDGQPAFRQDGAFSQTAYEQWLRSQGYSPRGFEQELRRSIIMEQQTNALAAAALATPKAVARLAQLEQQRRRLSVLVLAAARFRPTEIPPAEIEKRYQSDRDRLVSAEQVDLEILSVSRTAIAAGIVAEESELRSVYEARKANYATPEQREASHILVRLDREADEAVVEEARKKLLELKAELAAGAAFEDLAREHSEDPGSASQGGQLGSFGRGVMDPAFEEAAFSLAEGEVSDPVRSSFGLHLIRVTRIQAGGTPRTFDEVRETLLVEYQDEQADKIFSERAEALANFAFEHPESLAFAAEALDLPVQTLTDVVRDPTANEGLGAEPVVVTAAYVDEVLLEGNNSELVEIGDARVLVLRVRAHRPAKPLTLDDVRDQLTAELMDEAARTGAADAGAQLVRRLRGGETAEALAGELDLEWREEVMLERNSPALEPDLVAAAFRMPRPSADPVYDGISLASGDFGVIALAEVADGSAEEESERTALRARLESELGQAEFDAVLRALKGTAKVVVFEQNLQ